MTPSFALAVGPVLAAGPLLVDGDDTGKAGPLGLLVLILLGIACYFLFRSMSRHLRRVRDDFPAGAEGDRGADGIAPGPVASAAATQPDPGVTTVAGADDSSPPRQLNS